MSRRVFILPLSALVIAGLCAWRVANPRTPLDAGDRVLKAAAPHFELFDEHKPSQRVRLNTYLGRHQIVLVFFSRETGFHKDPMLEYLVRHWDDVKSAGIIVIGVSTAIPQENRAILKEHYADAPYTFRLLSDPLMYAHRRWGLFDEQTKEVAQGVFLIDRAGRVAVADGRPQPLDNPLTTIEKLLE